MRSVLIFYLLTGSAAVYSQSDSLWHQPAGIYQIYLKDSADELLELKYDKDCEEIPGKLNDDKTRVIMDNYKPGKKVYMLIKFSDGRVEEIRRSPCYIDPVIL